MGDRDRASLATWLEGDGSYRRLDMVSLVVVALIGLLSLPQPLWPNQATFALFSWEIGQGDVLYKDIIDLKQPGIFIYYLIAQLPFGRNAVGIHLVELVTWLGFGWVLQRQARSWFSRPWLAATLPVPLIGTYYLTAIYKDLTQVEALVNIPLLASVMLVMPDDDGGLSRRRAFLAGLTIAVVGYLKLPYVAIPLAVAVPTLWCSLRRDLAATWRELVLPALAGAGVLVVPFLVYFAINGAYGEIYEQYVEYSRERNELWPRPGDRFWRTVRRTGRIFSPYAVLGILGLVVNPKALLHRRAIAMVIWAVVAIPLFVVQQWWGYHVYLWLVPFTLFAWFSLDAIATSGRSLRDPLVGGGLVLASLALVTQLAPDGVDKVTTLASNGFAISQADRDELRREIDPEYADALAWSAWNRALGEESSAWGIGVSPNFLFVAGQDHEGTFLTWPTQLISVEIYDRIGRDLTDNPPTRFIVHDDAIEDMATRAPATLAVVESGFCVADEVGGFNYLLRADDPACP